MIPSRNIIRAALLISFAALAACKSANVPPAGPAVADALEITITPRLPGGDKVERIDVTVRIASPGAVENDVLLSMAMVRVMMPSALADPAALTATDTLGVVPLYIEEDPVDPSSFRQNRRWKTHRATEGDVIVSYALAPREIAPATLPGPLIDTRAELSGFYGSGNTMLALPPEGWPRSLRIEWELAEMPAGARAASSLGEGNVEARVSLENISNSFFMAGPLQSQPADGSGSFVAYWITPAAFDLDGAATWAEAAHAYFTKVFGEQQDAFRVFMRTTERFQGGGGGGFNSFIFGTVAGQDRDPREVRSLLAHETLHHFVGGYGEGGGAGGQQWYSEGATSYYTIVLPYRAGLTSLEEYVADFNAHALNYYTNPKSNLSNDEVTERFFSDRDAQLVPYNRGPLYFAKLDHQVRTASGGKKRLDDVIRAFIANRDDQSDASAYWRSLLVETLGPEGGENFDAMMAGKPLELTSDLFGPCFAGEETEMQNFAQGFRTYEKSDAITLGQIVPGSNAQIAGVAQDDVILNPDVLEGLSDTARGSSVTLELKQDGKNISVTYVPWTKPVKGLQWTRTRLGESKCNL